MVKGGNNNGNGWQDQSQQAQQAQLAEVTADRVVEVLIERYGITPHDLMATVKWVEAKRKSEERVNQAGITVLIGIVCTALVLALWEGIKSFLPGGR